MHHGSSIKSALLNELILFNVELFLEQIDELRLANEARFGEDVVHLQEEI